MRHLLLVPTLVALVLTSSFVPARAQHRLRPVSEMTGRPALELMLRKLDTVGNVMMTTAHPDDENNALLAYYGLTKGFRTSLVTATRGEGGQNEIGPEIFEALAVLRTEELLAVHKFDGAEQYFTRAVDFGFSFSVEETLEKWGGQVILGDYVRMIRTIRPDIIVGFVFDGEGGGQHHQSSSRLTSQAFRAAADPNAFPDQIAAGLRPWQAKKFYYTAGFGGPGGRGQALQGPGASTLFQFTGGEAYDPILGRTCNELAGEARSMHKCQGMSQLLPLPGVSEGFGPAGPRGYRLLDTVLEGGVNRPDPEMFDGVDTSLTSLARYAGATPPAALATALQTIATRVADARTAVLSSGSSAAVAPLAAGLKAVRALRAELKGLNLPAAGLYEIDTRLALKETQFQQALVLAADVRLDAVANDSLVVGGQPVQVQIIAANRGDAPVSLGGAIAGFTTRHRRLRRGGAGAEGGAQLPHDRHRAGRCAAHRRALQVRHRRRALRARRRRAGRPAVPAHAVHRQRGAHDRRGSRGHPGAGGLALGRQSLQRREARRAARGAEVRGHGLARDRDRAGHRRCRAPGATCASRS